jgi:hypothetical protein
MSEIRVHGLTLDPEVTKIDRKELKAKLVAVLDRGITNDRLAVDLPGHVHGEWVVNDPMEIARVQALGFEVDNQYAPKRSLHSDGSTTAIVGDVIHMVCSKEVKEVIDEIRRERFIAEHGSAAPSGMDNLPEERGFKTAMVGAGVKVIDESKAGVVGADEVNIAIRAHKSENAQ